MQFINVVYLNYIIYEMKSYCTNFGNCFIDKKPQNNKKNLWFILVVNITNIPKLKFFEGFDINDLYQVIDEYFTR